MANVYAWAVAGLASLAIVWYGVELVLAEVFPWRVLRQQFHGRPVLKTKSYAGRTALVTGANGAFGSRAARLFAHHGIAVLVLVDVQDCTELKENLVSELVSSGLNPDQLPEILVWKLDMMSFEGCRELARRAKSLPSLDHALMTMGILSFKRRESPEGWETSIQVNYLSNALISLLLLPILKSSESNPSPPVLTFITSFGVFPASPTMSMPGNGAYLRHLSNNKDGLAQAHQYGRSKGLLLYFARELSRRVSDSSNPAIRQRVTINSADPGTAWTGLTAPNQSQLIPRLITNFGARDPLICATALVNGVSCGKEGHGRIMMDFDVARYPAFMDRSSGRKKQSTVWAETRAELEAKAPEVKEVFAMLDELQS